MKHAGFAVFIFALALFATYLSYQIYKTMTVRSGAFDVAASFTFGPQDADLKVVSFFSYDCVPCQNIDPLFLDAVKRDGHVLYIPRPVLSDAPESAHAAVLAYGAAKQGKFIDMHEALIANFRIINEEVLNEIGKTKSIDLDRLGLDVKDTGVTAQIKENQGLYKRLGVATLPVFLIGEDMLYVPPGDAKLRVEDILELFRQARAKQ